MEVSTGVDSAYMDLAPMVRLVIEQVTARHVRRLT